jgi:DNA-binding beta-propeller fold protein YncE
MNHRSRYVFALILLLLTIVMALAAVSIAGANGYEVVASGLNNPRGLAFGPDGRLYVAEAGSGGDGQCAPGPEGIRCYGTSGSVTQIDLRKGTQNRIATGIHSLAGEEDGSFATGVHDISFQGRGGAYLTLGFGGDPRERVAQFGPEGANFAQQMRMVASGNWSLINDLGDYEIGNNPTGDEIDSNPYGILALPGKQIIADAGANDLLQVRTNGEISTLAIFPDRLVDAPPFLGLPPGTQIPMDAVPTSVTQGPDGDYYVGQLTGFPFPVGDAYVFKVPAEGGDPVVYASGFTNIIDVEFDADGNLYVLEIAKNGLLGAFGPPFDWTGALIRVDADDGTRTEIASAGLFAPGGIAIGRDGALYVTNNSIFSGSGEVLKIYP